MLQLLETTVRCCGIAEIQFTEFGQACQTLYSKVAYIRGFEAQLFKPSQMRKVRNLSIRKWSTSQ